MTEDAARPDPALVEAEVRRLLGDAYAGDPRARLHAVLEPHAWHAAVAQRLAEIKADAVDDLTPDSSVDKAALAREFGFTRQRIGQLKAQAQKRRTPQATKDSKES
jgi:hypothetical protein